MTARSTVHDTFVIERTLAFAPAVVFAAWTSADAKSRWFVGPPGWEARERTLDFRVGGHERLIGAMPNGTVTTFDARFMDIVPGARIVYVYAMQRDGVPISVSLATIEFEAAGRGTRLVVTEQGTFLDAFDDARGREHGTGNLLEQLARALSAAR